MCECVREEGREEEREIGRREETPVYCLDLALSPGHSQILSHTNFSTDAQNLGVAWERASLGRCSSFER